jgi:chromosome segregation ATPase
VLGVLLLIVRQLRKRTIRRAYTSRLPGQSPVIGVNLGSRRHGIKNLKQRRLASVPERREKQTKSKKTTESSEKLHEQIKQLQCEIIKRKQMEVSLEQRVAHLTAANEKFRREVAESRQVERQPSQEVAEAPADDEKLQPEVAEKKQAEQDFKEEVAEAPAADEKLQPEVAEEKQAEQDLKEQAAEAPAETKPPKKKPAESSSKYEDFHRVVDDVKQKLCRKCNEWKPESEFYKNASCKDGLAGSCKVCKAKAAQQYRERRRAEKNNGQ